MEVDSYGSRFSTYQLDFYDGMFWDDVEDLLIDGEYAVCAYKTIRDSAVFTNKRLIVRDAQGLTGKKVEIYTLPYSSINMYSSENAGFFFIGV